MKIFSLKSIVDSLAWSLGLGFILDYISTFKHNYDLYNCTGDSCIAILNQKLFPFGNLYLNFLFWVLVVFIILSLIRYFKIKKV